jgi:OHCU decarboxylase
MQETRRALGDVNAMDEQAFVAAFGGLFEHSPWVAEGAWRRRPFASVAELEAAFGAALREAPLERKLALLRAHPELAGREAAAGELTASSEREQGGAGLDRLSAGELEALRRLNADYRECFGFPFIVCVREHTKDSILASGAARLAHPVARERDVALGEVLKIARLRLEDVIE